jgi:hypothetical protein
MKSQITKDPSQQPKKLCVDRLWIVTISAVCLFISSSCSKNNVISMPKPVSDTIVYIAGSGAAASGPLGAAKYWKNGNAVILSDGTKAESACSIFANGNDIYVAGTESVGSNSFAKFWKNGFES